MNTARAVVDSSATGSTQRVRPLGNMTSVRTASPRSEGVDVTAGCGAVATAAQRVAAPAARIAAPTSADRMPNATQDDLLDIEATSLEEQGLTREDHQDGEHRSRERNADPPG